MSAFINGVDDRIDRAQFGEGVALSRSSGKLTPIELNKRAFWLRWLKWLLFVHDYDPYEMFKSPRKIDREDRHECARQPQRHAMVTNRANSLWLPTTESDHRRHRCTHTIRLLSIYIFVKMLLISILQQTILRHQRSISCGRSAPLLSLATLNWLSYYLGNPLYLYRNSTMAFYVLPAAASIVAFILLPIYFTRHPMNLSSLRFVMNPLHELKRVDLNIEQKLANLRNSLVAYEQCVRLTSSRSHCSAKQHTPRPSGTRNLMDCELAHIAQMGQHLEMLKSRPQILRPVALFTAAYFESQSTKMRLLVDGVQFSYMFINVVLVILLYRTPYLEACRQHKAKLAGTNQMPTVSWNSNRFCNPIEIFSIPDLVVLLELSYSMIMNLFIATLNSILFLHAIMNQLHLIKSIKKQLLACLYAQMKYNSTLMEVCANPREPRDAAVHERQVFNSRFKFEAFILVALIRLQVCENELLNNAHNITKLTIMPCFYAMNFLLMVLATSLPGNLDLERSFRYTVCLSTWCYLNAIAIFCAYTYSRVLDFERILWPILASDAIAAELNHKEESKNLPLTRVCWREEERPRRRATFVADLWARLVFATSLNVQHYCVQPFGIKLTYERIIELNFFSVFVYTLVVGQRR